MNDDPDAGWSASLTLDSADETAALAVALGELLGPGDTLLLSGPIGAGKSHFARALIRSRLAEHGLAEDIPSPTFTLVQTYLAGDLEIWHADLYRLTMVDEVVELGLADAFQTALCLVEWPDRLGNEAPADALHLNLALADAEDVRRLTFSAKGGKWHRIRAFVEEFHDAHR
ncbi:MAG: tRNA (adenosine(37)-N6)-threonylcarbamoyltransferase complex ATPase subunit type 1 TsaE [Rhodobacteraceae bacterium]|nr:tRNA (adenosine(37)-N6)-threonylcarbamoyltransferase complex ATPase subunit type 1 TsaE [Paracoccaceae bacterium]